MGVLADLIISRLLAGGVHVERRDFRGDPRCLWYDEPNLTISTGAFEHLYDVAKGALQSKRFRMGERALIKRIEKHCAFVRGFLQRIQDGQDVHFIGKSMADLAKSGSASSGSEPTVLVDDIISLQKVWYLGLELVDAKSLVYTRPCGQTLSRFGCIRARRIRRSWWRAYHIGWRCAVAP
jgi:hypothetical protein